jgi:hypothetical protein
MATIYVTGAGSTNAHGCWFEHFNNLSHGLFWFFRQTELPGGPFKLGVGLNGAHR